jgi:TatD DNase family protein
VSLHSYRATEQVLDELSLHPVPGVVLHWWLGNATATRRAVELGCYFSVNTAMFRRPGTLRHLPIDRLLAETDHPFGDRSGPEPHRAGNVVPVELALARLHGLQPEETRRIMWRNFGQLLRTTDCLRLVNRRIRSYLIVGGE